jgi:hypothetical protein
VASVALIPKMSEDTNIHDIHFFNLTAKTWAEHLRTGVEGQKTRSATGVEHSQIHNKFDASHKITSGCPGKKKKL